MLNSGESGGQQLAVLGIILCNDAFMRVFQVQISDRRRVGAEVTLIFYILTISVFWTDFLKKLLGTLEPQFCYFVWCIKSCISLIKQHQLKSLFRKKVKKKIQETDQMRSKTSCSHLAPARLRLFFILGTKS